MPYPRDHKEKTRQKILTAAFRLFSMHGFEGVTIDELMASCGLTRGAFYAHFSGKAELYQQALSFSASDTILAGPRPKKMSSKRWLSEMLGHYLSIEHIEGHRPCPLAFLATDVTTQNDQTRQTYAEIYAEMNRAIFAIANEFGDCQEKDIPAITAMMIGAVAIARTMNNSKQASDLLACCRKEISSKLGLDD